MFVECNASFHIVSNEPSCYDRMTVFHLVDKVSIC